MKIYVIHILVAYASVLYNQYTCIRYTGTYNRSCFTKYLNIIRLYLLNCDSNSYLYAWYKIIYSQTILYYTRLIIYKVLIKNNNSIELGGPKLPKCKKWTSGPVACRDRWKWVVPRHAGDTPAQKSYCWSRNLPTTHLQTPPIRFKHTYDPTLNSHL